MSVDDSFLQLQLWIQGDIEVSLTEIDFEKIRPLDGSQHAGFEELCCQLASLEVASTEGEFFRTGKGGDAGVECYRCRTDGMEIGWQAKYHSKWTDSLSRQLDDSIRTALDKHPKLVEYIVCLPFNLPDAQPSRGRSAREKWNSWCAKWEQIAKENGRNLVITLWDKSRLITKLTKEDPAYLGRIQYWFDQENITETWLREQFEKAKASLGHRYTPETNVELPIRQDFFAFARNPELQAQIDQWFFSVAEKGKTAETTLRRVDSKEAKIHADQLNQSIHALTSLLGEGLLDLDRPYPIDNWNTAISACHSSTIEILHWIYQIPTFDPNSRTDTPERSAKYYLQKLMETLYEIDDALASNRWELTNKKAVLLQGPAGVGKSHLLADVVEHQIDNGGVALLVLGKSFIDDEPWQQILAQFDRSSTEQIKHFLGSLDAAAQVSGRRALICVDALNEHKGIDIWPRWLAAFLRTAAQFPRVGIILSCRSTYVVHVIPEELSENELVHVNHEGFSTDDGEAAQNYLDMRGIVRPGAPNLTPEFENPLFLKTCCDFLEKEGETELPKGLRGVTSIFKFYNKAIANSLTKRMQLDEHHEIIPKAINGFARLLVDSGRGYASRYEVIDLFESILNSGGYLERSLLSQFESEGLLAVEPVAQDDGSVVAMVRFTFERFSDHAIAKHLLDSHLNIDDASSSFQPNQPLHEFVFGERNYENAGVIEAIAIQLPERANIEILDVGHGDSWEIRDAFRESLLWREQSCFTEHTFDLVKNIFQQTDINDLLISISTEPLNRFNALFVHKKLVFMPMPERDEFWSVYLAQQGFEGSIRTLISWANQNGSGIVDEDRAYLAALMLTWFFAASHREVRDKATKALVCVLSQRLMLAVRLLNDMREVDDPYVQERLLAACYGAALQGADEPGLRELSQVVFNMIFAHESPPANVLLRDHAHGIIEYAAWRGILDESIDCELAKPPYRSLWPIEAVPDELIESYTEDHEHGTHSDQIVWSTNQHGDFAQYQVIYRLSDWSPASIDTTAFPTSLDLFVAWSEDFLQSATLEQSLALNAYICAVVGAQDTQGYQSTPESKRRDEAESVLKDLMTSEQWEDFRVRAKRFLPHELSQDPPQPACFDVAWGCRWICKRAHELGWTSERFGDFERHYASGYDRNNHRVERIGKKYQWLAFYEIVARMSDNLAYLGGSWERQDGKLPVYQGARQVLMRNIDPSLLVTRTQYDGWREWDKTWWVPFNPRLSAASPLERYEWLENESDVVNATTLIDLHDPKTERKWLALFGFSSWTGSGLYEGSKEIQRDTWFRLSCIVVHRDDQPQMVRSLKKKILVDPHSFPKIEFFGDFYLGELSWHPDLQNLDGWSEGDGLTKFAVPIRPTVASYICEHGNYDYSIDQTISIEIPAPWLARTMGLRLACGKSLNYVDSNNQNMFYDPCVIEQGPSAGLIDRDAFLEILDQNDLSAIWVIAGEKNAYGGHMSGVGFGGRFLHTAIYYLDDDGNWVRHFFSERKHPTRDQLEMFFEGEPVPKGIMTSDLAQTD